MTKKAKAGKPAKGAKKRSSTGADDFVSVARRLGADEDKARFEGKLGKIAKATNDRDEKHNRRS